MVRPDSLCVHRAEVCKFRPGKPSPIQPLTGLNNIGAQNDLETKPLLINSEPALQRLFSDSAGPFGTHLTAFKTLARQRGYHDRPPQVGVKSHIFSIYGYEGTGKTTLVQAIISWLKTCKPKTGDWYVRDEWSFETVKEVQKQIERIDKEQEWIVRESGKNSYCCIVADNLVCGALDRAFEMYDRLTRDRVVFLFLLSNERELFPRLSSEGKRPITPLRMRPLSADSAVAFLTHRIKEFRVKPPAQPAWLPNYRLFPFDEADIRYAFDTGTIFDRVQVDTVALRDFSVMVNRMLTKRLNALEEEFDITQKAEAEIGGTCQRL
jgi:hypothetical protein